MQNSEKVRLSELLSQNTNAEKITEVENERYITLSLYGKGAHERIIKDGKYPVPFLGYRVSSGQFIYSRIDARNGAYGIVTPELNGCVVSKDFPVYDIDTKKVLPCFLLRAVLSNSFIRQVKNSSFGATNRMRIKEEVLESYSIPLPSLEHQSEITARLDVIEQVILNRKYELGLLDELVKARFVEMFGNFKTNPMGWPVVSFEEIAIIDGNMTTDYEKYADYPHIGIDSIEKETGLLKGYRTVAQDGVISGKYVFTSAHIIYSKIRPNLNKVALPDFDGLCSADAYPILPIKGMCNRVFLAYDMRSKFFLDYILQFCNRTNLPKVNRKEVMGFRTPLPPIELQNEFAVFVAQVDKSKVICIKRTNSYNLSVK